MFEKGPWSTWNEQGALIFRRALSCLRFDVLTSVTPLCFSSTQRLWRFCAQFSVEKRPGQAIRGLVKLFFVFVFPPNLSSPQTTVCTDVCFILQGCIARDRYGQETFRSTYNEPHISILRLILASVDKIPTKHYRQISKTWVNFLHEHERESMSAARSVQVLECSNLFNFPL